MTRLAHLDDDDFYDGAPLPRVHPVDIDQIDPEDLDWALHLAFVNMRAVSEGASFLRLSESADIISCRGAQPLHHDRHIAGDDGATSPLNHTWNLVIEGDGSQMLLQAVAKDTYTHTPMTRGTFVYMNTLNHHAVSRLKRDDVLVLVQVSGFTDEHPEEAFAALRATLRDRQTMPRLFEAA